MFPVHAAATPARVRALILRNRRFIGGTPSEKGKDFSLSRPGTRTDHALVTLMEGRLSAGPATKNRRRPHIFFDSNPSNRVRVQSYFDILARAEIPTPVVD